jgi:hypothetical protein
MPLFTAYNGPQSIKMLYLGHSGSGKTGSLVSLASSGHRVRILDLDNKASIIRDYVTNPTSMYLHTRPGLWTEEIAKETPSRISYVTITESYNIEGARAVPKGDSWHRINQQLLNWTDGEDKPGHITKWEPNDVLVIDSFSRYCEAAFNYQLSLTGNLAKGPQVGGRGSGGNDYNAAYKLILDAMQLFKSAEVKCNVILICHVVFMEPEGPQVTADRQLRGFPQVYGRAMISPMISQYFGHAIRAVSRGNGPSVRRTIMTTNDDNVELINPAPLRVKQNYPLETGLAEYFRDIRSGEVGFAQ